MASESLGDIIPKFHGNRLYSMYLRLHNKTLNRIYQAFPVDIKNPAGFFAALSIISFHDNLSLTLHLVFMISDKFFRKTR